MSVSSTEQLPPDNNDDRRVAQRWNLRAPLNVFESQADRLLGQAVNVSLRGMLVVCDQPLAIGQGLTVDLELPTSDGQWQRTPLTVHGLRCEQNADDGSYSIGFQFEQVPPQAIFSLQRLIDDLSSFS